MKRIKKGDEIIVIAGKSKGQRGKVLQVKGEKVLVENINIAKKAVRPNPNAGESGGIVEKEVPIHISNVMIYNPSSGKGERVGFKLLKNGNKVRCFRSNGEQIN